MQYYGAIKAGLPVDQSLLNWFASKELDPRAEQAANELFDTHKERVEIDHMYPVGEIHPFGSYDLNIHVDWGEDGLTGVLPYTPFDTPKPMAYWASDTHLGYDYRLATARKADYVFCAQKKAVDDMKRDGIPNPIWLPHAVEPQAYPKFDLLAKKYDICFVGHVSSGNRVKALDRMFKEFPSFYYGQRLFEDASRKYAESKVVFNIAMKEDVNMRCFEALASGSFLLTDYVPSIDEIFEDGKHLVLYRTLDEAVDKAKYYLAHDDEREKIAQAGYEEVIKKHTIQHRVSRILEEHLNSGRTLNASLSVG
jgi:glycosyltransferase involved in cell wall biosynthesis